MKTIGGFIKQQRALKKWSLRELSGKSGVSHSHIALLEADQSQPTMVTIEKLAQGFGITLEQFLIGSGYLSENFNLTKPTGTAL